MNGNNNKRGLIRILRNFMASYNGRVLLHYMYSWGASLVILGALFKLTHLPGANLMLFIAMGTEVLVFFISAFDSRYISGNGFDEQEEKSASVDPMPLTDTAAKNIVTQPVSQTVSQPILQPTPQQSIASPVSYAEAIWLASDSPELADATQAYLSNLEKMTEALERFNVATGSLTQISDSITINSSGYVQQMEALNRNISGLNTIYEIQLKGVSSQIDNIDKVNVGLARIREMYEGSTGNSEKFNVEAEKMAKQVEELNAVYERMLKAMTVNMK